MTMRIELSVHAVGLKNVAGAFKGTSDPFAVATHVSTDPGKAPKVLGKTETVKNTLSPQFVKTFDFDYSLGSPYKIVVSLFDEVRKGDNKAMGSAIFDVGELLGARGNTKAKRLKQGGTLFAHVRKSQGSGVLRLKLKGLKLKNTEGMLRKSDPFFELSRRINSAGAATWDNVFRSDPVMNDLSPAWKDAVVPLSTLCGGDHDLPILVSVYDHEPKGKHVPMGQFETSVNGLVAASTNGAEDAGRAIPLKKKGKPTGSVVVLKAEVAGANKDDSVTEAMSKTSISSPPSSPTTKPSFVDYVAGGCHLNVVVAIDFTGSNGNPRQPGTLHYLSPDGAKNDYEKAISSVLRVLSKYDTDQMYPVLGFGAKYDGVVRHAFQCGDAPKVHGIDGVLKAYRQVFQSGLIMSSPTDFTQVIQAAARQAMAQPEEQSYTILLIVSDGAVSDVQATAACLEQVSDSPLSVVIVGVGGADFSAMEFLDDHPAGKRDIAQFVEFQKHQDNPVSLSSVTLREIPEQLVSYFQSKGIAPLPPILCDEAEIVVEEEEEEIDLTLDVGEEEIVVSGGGFREVSW